MNINLSKQKIVSQKQLKEIFNYNPKTGIFTRIKDSQKYKKGHVSGYTNTQSGYVYIKINYICYLAHRLAWLYMTGKWPIENIDHIDLNKGNNIWKNLREANAYGNNYNKKLSKRNTTGFKGIWFDEKRGKWEAKIFFNGKRFHLGRFRSIKDAALAYDKAAKNLHGKFYRRINP